jgi:rod shape determining protein RodA
MNKYASKAASLVMALIRRTVDAFKKGDKLLLLLCIVTTAFGCLIISSATRYTGSFQFVIIQILAAAGGVFLYALVSSVDADFISEHRTGLVGICCFTLLLLIPFGTDIGSGNKSWLDLPILPFYVQPAEICKIFYILITASVMNAQKNRISHPKSVIRIFAYMVLIVGLNMVLSGDAGVSLIFVFIFIGMTWSGGVNFIWFALAAGAIVLAIPVVWPMMPEYQRGRFEVLFNPDLDPLGIDERYHTVRSLRSLTGGGMTGQGLFQGHRTQNGALNAQHTDYIFSAIGEELGYVGCIFVLVLMALIIGRCIYVGCRSTDYMRKLICFGAASALIFQVMINVGMCIGVMPVIGLTLPFISYGGSSILSLYAMLGLVSGVYARPKATSHERYIRPPL